MQLFGNFSTEKQLHPTRQIIQEADCWSLHLSGHRLACTYTGLKAGQGVKCRDTFLLLSAYLLPQHGCSLQIPDPECFAVPCICISFAIQLLLWPSSTIAIFSNTFRKEQSRWDCTGTILTLSQHMSTGKPRSTLLPEMQHLRMLSLQFKMK